MTLDNPSFHTSLKGENIFNQEFGLTNELNTAERAHAFRLTNDSEYMLKYQLVALAKYHNFYGRMDDYMREFATMCHKM